MTVHDSEPPEGWYTDPFGRHEARWMSGGRPTKLVRDAGVDTYDEPPDETPAHEAVPVEHPEAARADDLRRADAAEAGAPFTDAEAGEAATDIVVEGTLD